MNESTYSWQNRVEVTEDLDDLRALLAQMASQTQDWQSFLRNEKDSRGLTSGIIAARCGVSRQAIEKYINHGTMPKTREGFIALGLALQMELARINHMLQRYGHYPRLYPRNVFDAICIYVCGRISGGRAGEEEQAAPLTRVRALQAELDRQLAAMPPPVAGVAGENVPTEVIGRHIQESGMDADFITYILSRPQLFFAPSYRLLNQYITWLVSADIIDPADPDKRTNTHQMIEYGILNRSFERILSDLRAKDVAPRRQKLLALGVSLGLTVEMLNRMLALARMEPLYAKNRVEMVLLYTIRSAHLNDPTLEYDLAYRLVKLAGDDANALLEDRRAADAILRWHDTMYTAPMPQSGPSAGVSSQVRHAFLQLGMQDEAAELLRLLADDAAQP